jgi:transposase
MDAFYEWLGPRRDSKIMLAVMDMWKPFAISLRKEGHALQAAILFAKFHVMRHLGDALDKVRRSEHRRLSGKERTFLKGQRYTLLSNAENLTAEGRDSLKKLLAANKRLNTAYLLKESFDRLWTYKSEAWMRKFFDNWKASLKWQRLDPFVKFSELVERNWDGLAAYCGIEEKPSLGFVEGLNTKIRVIQRRAYGLRDEEYLRLKILTAMLPDL